MKLFLDTNILIDYFGRRMPFFEDVYKINIAQIFGDVELWVSTQSFPDIEYILKKAVPLSELRYAFNKSLDFLNVIGTIDTDVKNGIDEEWSDLEDSYIAFAAKRINADYIITRDLKGFPKSAVPALTPSEWLEQMKDEGVIYGTMDF